MWSMKCSHFILHIEPLKMDLTEGSETSAKHNLTQGKYPKEHIQVSEHGENLKSRIQHLFLPLRISISYLSLLPRLLFPSTYLSITCCRRQFLRKICQIQLAFLRFVVYRMFLTSLTVLYFVTQTAQLHTVKNVDTQVRACAWLPILSWSYSWFVLRRSQCNWW
jgi:hypothetical protein